jgi:hypothetical protein
MPLPADAVAPTGYAPFSSGNTLDSGVYSFLTYAQGGQKVSIERRISRLLRKPQMAVIREVIETLNGAAVGGTALATKPLVRAQTTSPGDPLELTELGGVRQVDVVNLINRVTVASDETYVDALLQVRHGQAIASYPVDLGGNGGGGKLNR